MPIENIESIGFESDETMKPILDKIEDLDNKLPITTTDDGASGP